MTRRALVLGAGGHAASAWELGVITGMADVGAGVRDADVIVGTSAGSRVGVHIWRPRSLPRRSTLRAGVPISCARKRAPATPLPCSSALASWRSRRLPIY